MIFTIIFYACLFGLAIKFRKRFRIEGLKIEEKDPIGKRKPEWVGKMIPLIFLYPSKKLKDIMVNFSRKHTRLGRFVGTVGVFVILLVSIFAAYIFINIALDSVSAPTEFAADPNNKVVVLLPGFSIPLVSGFIALAIGMFVHESFHAWVGISYGYEVEETGFGLLLFLPLAYVKFKDEEAMFKSPPPHYIKFIMAGVFGNFLCMVLFFLIANFIISVEVIRLTITLNLLLALINSFPIFGMTDGMHAINGFIAKFIPVFEERSGLLSYIAMVGTFIFLAPILISIIF